MEIPVEMLKEIRESGYDQELVFTQIRKLLDSDKPIMQGSRVETIEAARKEYAELLKEGWKKTSIFRSYF